MEEVIKLRAWDKINKRMCYFKSGFGWNDEYNIWCLIPEDNQQYDICDVPCNENIEFSRSLGLNDRNKKEIYSGDIIFSWDNGNPRKEYKHLVVWDGHSFQFKSLGKGIDKVISSTMLHARDTNVEIIGNIYQNPEMLWKIQKKQY